MEDKDTDIRITLSELRIIKRALENLARSNYANARNHWDRLNVEDAKRWRNKQRDTEEILKSIKYHIKLLEVPDKQT